MMKRWLLFLTAYFCLCLLSACGAAPASPAPPDPSDTPAPQSADAPAPQSKDVSLAQDETPAVLRCRIVDGAESGDLLLADLDGGGVYRLPAKDLPVTLDGEAADPSVLEDGMAVKVTFNGHVLETYPAQFGEVYTLETWSRGQGENGMGTTFDLCGLYLQVLDDLWQKDPGLNDNITLAGLDLSRAPGELTESEKAAVAWRFGETHGVEVITGTFDELRDQGYFTAKTLQYTGESPMVPSTFYEWEDGCLFSIKPNETHGEEQYSLPTLRFDAEKWRSPLGAYIFHDCCAVWPEAGTWESYTVGSEMIS